MDHGLRYHVPQSLRECRKLGKLDIAKIRAHLQSAFDPAAAADLDVVYQFQFEDAESYHLVIHDGRLKVHAGEHARPSIRLMFDSAATAEGVIDGSIDATQAFMQGRVRSDGNLLLAMRLRMLFPPQR